MATTEIKSGWNGGSDNQLLINADGSINVNGGGSSGTTKITDSTGAPIIASGGALTTTTAGWSTVSPGYPNQTSVGITSTQLFGVNLNRKYAHIMNNSDNTIYIQFQVSAALNQGIPIGPRGFYTIETTNLFQGVVNAIGNVAGILIDCLEGE